MPIKKIEKPLLDAWVDGLTTTQKVVGVKAEDDKFSFAPLSSSAELRLDYDVTLQSPKSLLLPAVEEIAEFGDGENYRSVIEDGPFVIFGVHPYDMVAINQMDTIFSSDNYDVHYMARRKNVTVVACDVQNASENVFAGCMGTAVVDDGFDVLITRTGAAYLVDARTEKGLKLIEALGDAPEADANDLAAREDVWEQNKKTLRKHELKCAPTDLPALLDGAEDHPVWEEKSKLCFSCGSCNLVCPTCYCFDVQDEVNWDMKSGKRKRTWDGCMLEEFALVAGGHNFRGERAERFRHRYYRKGSYLWHRFGQIACVGCGRCISACVAKIANPVEVYNELLEGRQ